MKKLFLLIIALVMISGVASAEPTEVTKGALKITGVIEAKRS